jgi:hypothetical protein
MNSMQLLVIKVSDIFQCCFRKDNLTHILWLYIILNFVAGFDICYELAIAYTLVIYYS